MNDARPTSEHQSQPDPTSRRRLLILSIISGAVLLFVAVAILVYIALRGPAQPTVETPVPTDGLEVTPTEAVSAGPTPSCRTILSSGDVEISMALPVSLTIQGATYPVEPFVPPDDAWVHPSDRSSQAVWVCGSVVNYVVGLEPNEANQEMVAGLAPGDEIRLQFTNGAVLVFRFSEREQVSPGAEVALDQQEPRLTLVLGESETWQIAIAEYAAGGEATEPPSAGPSAEVGQAVDVGAARVTVAEGQLSTSGELSPGTAHFLVEFSVENTGGEPLQTDLFNMELHDDLGNRYPFSPQASAAGASGPPSGDVQPGASSQASAGYLVPVPLPQGDLTWMFSPRPGAEVASVRIPYEGEIANGGPAEQPDVIITDAFLGDGGAILVIEGELQNRGTEPLVVEADDVNLSSSAGAGQRIMEAPPLPWRVEPGQRQVVELQYGTPDAETALLEILGFSFEIDGLQ